MRLTLQLSVPGGGVGGGWKWRKGGQRHSVELVEKQLTPNWGADETKRHVPFRNVICNNC